MKNELTLDDKLNTLIALKNEYTSMYEQVEKLITNNESFIDVIMFWFNRGNAMEQTYNNVKKAIWSNL